jgi:ATP-dependent exoDNAse (exonuclease V) alpha subunit
MEHRIIEEKIARESYSISNARGFELKGASGVIADCEKSTGFTYSEEQRQAIYNCLTNNVVLITGLAGAGKSSVMYPVTQIIKNNQKTSKNSVYKICIFDL